LGWLFGVVPEEIWELEKENEMKNLFNKYCDFIGVENEGF
jgi:hypothetical protein